MYQLQKNKLRILEETVLYYSENTKRRCLHHDEDKTICFYYGANNVNAESDGCAIGRLLPKELADKFDREYSFNNKKGSVIKLFDLLPLELQEYGLPFLSQLQSFHDKNYYWTDNGLSAFGEALVERFKIEIEKNVI